MPKKNNKIRPVVVQGSSDEDHTSLSDLKKLMETQYKDIMPKIQYIMSKIQEVNGRVMNLEDGMERLSIATKSNMIETKAHSTGPRCLKLVFRNKISLSVLNGEEIKGEGGKYIEIALVDEVTGNVIDFGQEASAHVLIVALEGDSDHFERDNWVIGNYKKKSVSVSDNKEERSVLVGQVKVKLNKGIGSLANLKFRNSSNHNSGVFKLGAKVMDSFDGTLIKEAMTEPFVVKDFREKYKQKHYPPSLSDEIWRLENIQKGGSIFERVKEKVKTVEDFLIQLLKYPAELKCLLHLPEKKWKATVDHAKTCRINQRVYCSINSQEKIGVVFNVVGNTLGLIKDWNYVQHGMLSEEDKVEAGKLFAFKKEVKDFDNEDSLLQYLSCQSTAAPTNSPGPENTVSHIETSNIGESDQSNIDASFQVAWTSNYPNRGIVSQEVEATDLDRVDLQNVFPSDHRACTGPDFDNEDSLLQYLSCQSTAAPTNSPGPENTVSHIETSNIGESDQSNIDASFQVAWTSNYPNRGIVSQEVEATDLDRVDLQNVFPSDHRACTGPEATLHGPIHVDQANVDDMNLIASSQELLGSKNPSGGSALRYAEAFVPDGLGFQAIFPSISPTGNTGLGCPLYSPYNDQPKNFDASLKDALLSKSPSKVEASNEFEASESHGYDLQDMEIMSNDSFLNPQKKYPPMGPLWESIDQYNIPSSSSLIDDDSYWCTQFHAGQSYSSSNLWSEGCFIDYLRQAANKSWNILLWVIKWCLKVKKAASKRNRLKKKQRIS